MPSHDVLLVIGDLNAKVGRSNEGREKTMGKNGCGEMNENGERLADICGLNDLVIGGTIFEHKEIHKLTWISPDGNVKNQIDHVLINGRWKHSLHNVTVKRGADVASDHHLLLATVKLQLRRNPIKMEEKGQRYNIARLRNPDVRKNFFIAVKNKYEALSNIDEEAERDAESAWRIAKESYLHACECVLGKKRKRDKNWISAETWSLINKRREIKEKKGSARSQRLIEKLSAEYSLANREVRKHLWKDKRMHYENLASQAEQAAIRGEQSELYRITRDLSGKFQGECDAVKDKDGKRITIEDKQLQRWAEDFREVLNRSDPAERACISQPLGDKLDIDCSPPTKNEILKAIKSLKNNKAPGIDNITAEVLKTDIRFATDWLYDLFYKIWNVETIPEDWCRGLIVKLPKKGDRTQCTNWRGITLLSVPSKIFCKIIQMRLSDAINTILREEQAGFRPGVGCIDHIFTLRNIIEQCIEWNTKVHINFIDLEKAFDSIHRDTLWRILLAYGCPEKIINIIKCFYNNFSCSVIHKKKLTDWFSVRSGVHQGCVLSPMLFLVAIDWIMRKTVGNKRRGIRWTLTSLLEDLDFADDVALVSSTRDQLQRKTSDLSLAANQLGLNISRKKTKTMQLTETPLPVELENENLEEVEEFTYLGSIMSKSNATVKDITNRLQKAKSSFVQLNKIWRSPNISEKTKIKIYHSNVLSVLLYGAECWRVTQRDSQRLSGFHTSCLRKICRIYWPQKITNKELYQRTGQRDITMVIMQRRWRWLGHVIRKDRDSITRTALRWTPDSGRRKRGRPRETWRRTIEAEMRTAGKTWKELEKAAMDREQWKSLVSALCAT